MRTREWLRTVWSGSRQPPRPLADPNDVLGDWPLGEFDRSAAALIESSGVVPLSAPMQRPGVLAHDVVAILEPMDKYADHYRIFDHAGIAIGAVIARRSRWDPYLFRDHVVQLIDCTGSVFAMKWWSSVATNVFRGETSAVVHQSFNGPFLGSCSADDKGRWQLRDVEDRLVGTNECQPRGILFGPDGKTLGKVKDAGTRRISLWPWQRHGMYSYARVLEFDRSCDAPTRTLLLATAICAEVQALEDLSIG